MRRFSVFSSAIVISLLAMTGTGQAGMVGETVILRWATGAGGHTDTVVVDADAPELYEFEDGSTFIVEREVDISDYQIHAHHNVAYTGYGGGTVYAVTVTITDISFSEGGEIGSVEVLEQNDTAYVEEWTGDSIQIKLGGGCGGWGCSNSGPFEHRITVQLHQNYPPVLSDPLLAPDAGYAGHEFNWQVTYSDLDNLVPTVRYVVVQSPVTGDWQYHWMQTTDTDFAAGALYSVGVALPDTGLYHYRFEFADEVRSVYLPEWPGTFSGPLVAMNQEPVLSNSSLAPASGPAGSDFTWEVVYSDVENDPPTLAAVLLGDPSGNWENYAMTSSDSSYTDGALYTLTMALPDTGLYSYRFNFTNDSGQSVQLPGAGGNFSGPQVGESVPILSDAGVSPASGNAGATFTFHVIYTEINNDLPTILAQVSVWSPATESWSDHPLTSSDSDCTDGSLYECPLVLVDAGEWRYRFTFINSSFQFVSEPADMGQYLTGPTVLDLSPVAEPVAGLRDWLGYTEPNPANPGCLIHFSLARPTWTSLTVFDLSGRHVRTLLAESRPAGPGSVFWDGRDAGGRILPSGAYFYRLKAGNYVETKRMTLLK